jgi:hypothetical protein
MENNDIELKIDKLVESTTNFLKRLGLPVEEKSDNDVTKWLSPSIEEIRGLPPDECANIAVLLSREARFIQTEINKINSKILFLEASLNRIISPKLSSYDKFISYEQKKSLVIAENEYAKKIDNLLIQLHIKLASISYLPGMINKQSDTFIELSRSKRSQK